MKKTILTTILLLPIMAMAQAPQLPDSITIHKGQYLRIDSLIQATSNKLVQSDLASKQVQQIISDIQYTLQVIGYQIGIENKKKVLPLSKKK